MKKFGDPLFNTRRDNGTFTIHKGYKLIRVNGKQIPEHRYIMEQSIKRKLNPKEHIHHINHDKVDNRIENLKIMRPGEHISHHKKGVCLRKENSSKVKFCPSCKSVFPRVKFTPNPSRSDGIEAWCTTCRRHRQHKFVKKCPRCSINRP